MTELRTIAPWMQTHMGLAVDLTRPDISQIDLRDISVSLERIPRFNGHTVKRVWSVAHHSHLVANLLPIVTDDDDPSLRLAALLDDAHEAYLGDPIAPVKAAFVELLGFDPYKILEAPLRAVIREWAGLPAELPPEWTTAIKTADLTALHIEKRLFMSEPPRPWVDLPSLPDDPQAEVDAIDLYFGGDGDFAHLIERVWEDVASDL